MINWFATLFAGVERGCLLEMCRKNWSNTVADKTWSSSGVRFPDWQPGLVPLSPFPQDRFDKDSTSWLIFAGVWVMGVSGEWEIGGVWSHCAGLWWGQKKQHGAVVCYSSVLWWRRMGGQCWFPWKDPGGFISVLGELLLSHPKQRQWKQASSIPLWTLLSHFTSVLWFNPHSRFFLY